MKKCKRLMTFVAVLLAFALTFSSVSIPASAATTKSITVKNLPGNTLTIKAKKTFVVKTNVAASKLRFSSSNKKIATVTTSGKIKAIKNGKANITISLKANSKVRKVIKVTVGQPVTRVKLNRTSLKLLKGRSARLKATVAGRKASNNKVIWKSSNSRIAKVNSAGKVIAVKAGSAVITATAADGSGKKVSCRVKVLTPATSLRFDKAEYILTPGKSVKIKTSFSPANVSSKKLRWSVSDTRVATVDKNGNLKGIGAGTATVTANALDGSGKKATSKVTVKVPVSGIKLDKYKETLLVGATTTLKATVQPSNATDKRYIWSSSDENVAIVSASGKVVAVAEGTAVITAAAADGSGKKASYTVTVSTSVTIESTSVSDPQTVTVTLSGAQKLSASNFSVKETTVLNGAYNKNIPLESVTTKDNKTYTLTFNKEYRLTDYLRICVFVNGLYGTGTAKAETYYVAGKRIKTAYEDYTCLQNEYMRRNVEVNYNGYFITSVKGLPAGVTYSLNKSNGTVRFTGTPTKAGITTTTITTTDELGYVVNEVITWHIYSNYVITGSYRPQYYMLKGDGEGVYVSSDIVVAGGSGSYIYSIQGSNYGLSVDESGSVNGTLTKAGNYNINVKVSDAANAKRYAVVKCSVNVTEGIVVTGLVKDKGGKIMPEATVRFVRKDQTSPYLPAKNPVYSGHTKEGVYSVSLLPGAYDVTVSINGCGDLTYVYNQTYTNSVSGVDFTTEVRRIEIESNSAGFTAEGIGEWDDVDGKTWGKDGYVYLLPGTYNLIASGNGTFGTIKATVTSSTTSITASLESNVVDFGDKTSVNAVLKKYYKFVPKTTGTYYFYSVSDSGDPNGFLYDSDLKQVRNVDDSRPQSKMSKNRYDFCMDYKCEEGKTYYLAVGRRDCKVYVTTEDPRK